MVCRQSWLGYVRCEQNNEDESKVSVRVFAMSSMAEGMTLSGGGRCSNVKFYSHEENRE